MNVESRLMLLNTSGATVTAQAVLYYETGGTMASVPLIVPALTAGSHVMVDLHDLGIPPSASSTGSIVVDHDGPEAALMGRVFGIANQNTFGFYTTLESNISASYAELYWTLEGDQDSLLTLTNFGEHTDTVTVVLTHNGGNSELPAFVLQPRQSVTVNVREWKQQGFLPATAEFGGFRIVGSSMKTSRVMVKEHVISVQRGTSAPFYGFWHYVCDYYLTPSSIDLWVGQGHDTYGVAVWNDSSETGDSPNMNGSSNFNIAVPTQWGVQAVGPGIAWVGGQSSQQYPTEETGTNYAYYNGSVMVEVTAFREVFDDLLQEGILESWEYTNGGSEVSITTNSIEALGSAALPAVCPFPSPPCLVWNAGAIAITVAIALAPAIAQIIRDATRDRQWQPCNPPVGTVGYLWHTPANNHNHWPFGNNHVHLFVAHQNPTNGRCFWVPTTTVAPPPPPGAVPITQFP